MAGNQEEKKELKNFVIGGGGTWGYAYIGAVEGLFDGRLYNEEDYNNIRNYVGTSIGSILVAFMACGADIKFLKERIKDVDPSKAADDSWGWFRDLYRIYSKFGMYKGDYLENTTRNIIDELFIMDMKKHESKIGNKKTKFTFNDVYNQFGKNLVLVGVNVNTRKTVYFNRLTHPNMEVAVAARISSGLPLIFKAYKYEEDLYVDGGVVDSYPIRFCATDMFKLLDSHYMSNVESQNTGNSRIGMIDETIMKAERDIHDLERDATNVDEIMCHTIGVKGYDNRTYKYVQNGSSSRIEDFTLFSYMKEILEMLMDIGLRTYIDSHLWERTVKLNMGSESVADFELTDEDINKLNNIGVNASKLFIDNNL